MSVRRRFRVEEQIPPICNYLLAGALPGGREQPAIRRGSLEEVNELPFPGLRCWSFIRQMGIGRKRPIWGFLGIGRPSASPVRSCIQRTANAPVSGVFLRPDFD